MPALARRQMFVQITRQQFEEMTCRTFSLKNPVGTIWISHHCEWLIVFHELVYQHLRPLIVNVVVARSVHDQQVALKAAGERDRGTLFEIIGIVLGQAHVTFLIDRVVETLVGHRRA